MINFYPENPLLILIYSSESTPGYYSDHRNILLILSGFDHINETESYTTEGVTVPCRPSGSGLRPLYENLKIGGFDT